MGCGSISPDASRRILISRVQFELCRTIRPCRICLSAENRRLISALKPLHSINELCASTEPHETKRTPRSRHGPSVHARLNVSLTIGRSTSASGRSDSASSASCGKTTARRPACQICLTKASWAGVRCTMTTTMKLDRRSLGTQRMLLRDLVCIVAWFRWIDGVDFGQQLPHSNHRDTKDRH